MHSVVLGNAGLEVSAVGFGAMVLSPGIYDRPDDAESMKTIAAVLDARVTLIDTADIYGDGHNERLVGRAIAGRRDQAVLATKFGGNSDEHGKLVNGLGRPDSVQRAADAGLRRLGVDHIDLYYQHRVDPTTPIEDTVGALAEMVGAGKVRYLGLSEASAQIIRRAHAVHPISAVETEYSLFARDPEEDVLPVTRELGIGFVAYSPLGRGFLGGQLRSIDDLAADDWRRTNPRFQGANFSYNVELADTIRAIADEKGLNATQLALAWLIRRGAVPIQGSRHASNMAENAAAAEIKLTDDELAQLEAIAPAGAAAGDRADSAYLGNVNR